MSSTMVAPSGGPSDVEAVGEPSTARTTVAGPGREPPRGPLRWLFDVPAVAYRLGLGWIFGRRYLMLTHRGRRSGAIRKTVVEAASFDPVTFESVVVAGWGDRTNWYRNIVASPAIAIETGGRRYHPMQRILEPVEVRDVLRGYLRRNPWARGVIERLGLGPTDGALPDARIAHLRGVAFRPDPALAPTRNGSMSRPAHRLGWPRTRS